MEPKKDVSRRSVLKAAGIGVGILSGGTVAGANNERTVRIPTHISRGEVVATERVPKRWYNQREKALNSIKALQKSHGADPAVAAIELTTSDRGVNGFKFLEPKVEIESGKGPRIDIRNRSNTPNIPDELNGVSIRKEEKKEVHLTSDSGTGCHGRKKYRPIPGGVAANDGTTGCQVLMDDDHYILTAAHLFGHCDGGDKGNDGVQGGEKYGDVADSDDSLDWAIVAPDPSDELNGRIQTPNDELVIGGYLTKSSIDSKMSQGDEINKVGSSTGMTTGEIVSTTASTGDGNCINLDGNGVAVTNDQAKGDSGSPVFDISFGSAFIASIATLGVGRDNSSCNNPKFEYGVGISAYYLAHEHDMVFCTEY